MSLPKPCKLQPVPCSVPSGWKGNPRPLPSRGWAGASIPWQCSRSAPHPARPGQARAHPSARWQLSLQQPNARREVKAPACVSLENRKLGFLSVLEISRDMQLGVVPPADRGSQCPWLTAYSSKNGQRWWWKAGHCQSWSVRRSSELWKLLQAVFTPPFPVPTSSPPLVTWASSDLSLALLHGPVAPPLPLSPACNAQ